MLHRNFPPHLKPKPRTHNASAPNWKRVLAPTEPLQSYGVVAALLEWAKPWGLLSRVPFRSRLAACGKRRTSAGALCHASKVKPSARRAEPRRGNHGSHGEQAR